MLTYPYLDLRALRTRLGIGQSELAAASGLSRQAIYLIERGLRKPTEVTMKALVRAMESLHVARAPVFERKSGFEVNDEESRQVGRHLETMSLEDLLSIRVRVTPYQVKVDERDQATPTPNNARSQLLDGLQALGIHRLFGGLFKLEVLPGWWTIADNFRAAHVRLDDPDLTFEDAQQRVIEEGPTK